MNRGSGCGVLKKGGSYAASGQQRNEETMFYRKFGKRFLDFFLSSIAIILLSPILLVVAVLVRIKLGSPVLFHQERPGKDEKYLPFVSSAP